MILISYTNLFFHYQSFIIEFFSNQRNASQIIQRNRFFSNKNVRIENQVQEEQTMGKVFNLI